MGAARKIEGQKIAEPMTVEEFLVWAATRDGPRYDLVDGVLRAHASPSDEHGTIHSYVGYLLTAHLDGAGSKCRVVSGGGVKPKFRANWNFRQPDITVTCMANVKGHHDIPSPVCMIEILSPSNVADTWDNVRNYMTIPSVLEIAVIHSTKVFAEMLVRGSDGQWPVDPVGLKASELLRLDSIAFEMQVAKAYVGTYLA